LREKGMPGFAETAFKSSAKSSLKDRSPRTEASKFVLALNPPPMPKHKFQIGDKVRVIGMSPVTFPPGVKDELGTEKLFKNMLGKVYTVRGFDRYRNVELRPKRLDTVWVEPEFLKLRARKRKSR
jgi:hypothetical protein